MIKRDPSKALLVGFFALLLVSTIQVAYWMADYIRYTNTVREQIAALYRVDAEVVTEFLRGRVPERLAAAKPHLEIDTASGMARVKPAALANLAFDSARRRNRYVWEGMFFLAVLIGGMAVLTRAIRHDRALRLRQQNFLAAVSHEFKSPLASVRLAAETLLMRSTEPSITRVARRIIDDGDRLLRMVDNLLGTSRLEEGRQALKPEWVPAALAVESVAVDFEERASLHGITLAREVDPDLELWADPAALDTILRNLVDNSIKACAAGNGRTITIRAERSDGGAALSVIDDGIGFPPEEAAMIFEKFHRIGDELRRSTPGTGLGLYIVKRLAELEDAQVRAASGGPGRGATVAVTWPAGGAR